MPPVLVLYAGVDDRSKVCQRKEVLVLVSSVVRMRNQRAKVAARLGTRASLANDNGDLAPQGIAWAQEQKKLLTRGRRHGYCR
jgi:hypothetical protein